MGADNYSGVIIEESLENTGILDRVKIVKTVISLVTEAHATPWLKQWTMHTVEIAESDADAVAELLRKSLDPKEQWYADFRNSKYHYVIFCDRIFLVDRTDREQYAKVKEYGIAKGIPDYQMDIF